MRWTTPAPQSPLLLGLWVTENAVSAYSVCGPDHRPKCLKFPALLLDGWTTSISVLPSEQSRGTGESGYLHRIQAVTSTTAQLSAALLPASYPAPTDLSLSSVSSQCSQNPVFCMLFFLLLITFTGLPTLSLYWKFHTGICPVGSIFLNCLFRGGGGSVIHFLYLASQFVITTCLREVV